MTYALIADGQIAFTAIPPAARRVDTGQWVTPLDGVWTDEQAAACGWLPITETTRPDDTPTVTWDWSVALVAGVPTVVWVERTITPPEPDPTQTRIAELEAQVVALMLAVAS